MKNNSYAGDIKGIKSSIRKDIQHKRDALDRGTRQEKSRLIASRLEDLKEYRDSSHVLAYYPFRSEIDTRLIIEDALSKSKKVALPRVGKDGLELYYVSDLSRDLEPGSYDIMEPAPSRCQAADPSGIDLVIVPGVAFDRDFNRLGYGGGFYDRLLSEISGDVPRIALAFELQLIEKVPVSGHDLKVDRLITEKQTI